MPRRLAGWMPITGHLSQPVKASSEPLAKRRDTTNQGETHGFGAAKAVDVKSTTAAANRCLRGNY